MMRSIWQLLRQRQGATAVEYGLLVGLLALITLASVTTMGTSLNSEFGVLGTKINNAG